MITHLIIQGYSKLTCAYELQRWLAGCTCQCVGSKLTCAYELQLFSPRGGRSSGLSKLTCAYELQPALLAGHSTDSLLETYLRIRIATSPCRCIKACILSSKLTCAYELQLLSEPSNSKDFSRNLPAHTNCNCACGSFFLSEITRNLPAHTNCNGFTSVDTTPAYKLETYLRIRIATISGRYLLNRNIVSKLTCAYELQPLVRLL